MATAAYTAEDYPRVSLIADMLHAHDIELPADYAGTSQDPTLALAFNAALRIGELSIFTERTYDLDLPEFQRVARRYNWDLLEDEWYFRWHLRKGNLLSERLTDTAWWHYLCATELTHRYNPKPVNQYHVSNGVRHMVASLHRFSPPDRLFDIDKMDALHGLQTQLWTYFPNHTDDGSFNATVLALAAHFTTLEIYRLTVEFQPTEIGVIGRTKLTFNTASLVETLHLLAALNPVLVLEMLPGDRWLDNHPSTVRPEYNYIPGVPHGLRQLQAV